MKPQSHSGYSGRITRSSTHQTKGEKTLKVWALLSLLGLTVFFVQCSPLQNGIVAVPSGTSFSSETFSVAVMGDIPYTERQVDLFADLIKDVNQDSTVELVLHAGDIKGAGSCTDQIYHDRFHLFQQFQPPFIYSIGDNEWKDCHHRENGRHNPIEAPQGFTINFF